MLRISNYATASTNTAAYIIGGYDGSEQVSTVAEYKNNQWRDTGTLNEPKSSPSAIVYDGEYMVLGGYLGSSSGR